MSVSTLPVLSAPHFPQHPTPKQQVAELFAFIEESLLRAPKFPVPPQPTLSLCCHETIVDDGGTGEFNQVFPCVKPATIHDLATEQDFCFEHYRAVGRG